MTELWADCPRMFASSLLSGRLGDIAQTIAVHQFQHSLFLKIRTLDTLLKSNLLLKIECFDTHKQNVYKQMRRSIIWERK